MKFLTNKQLVARLLDHKRSELITEILKITPTTEYLQQDRRNWLQHINRMELSGLIRQMLHHVPKGRWSRWGISEEMTGDRNRPQGLQWEG
jgi:hypothetical protein